ncbi:MAG: hypothetical protein AB7P08_18200 [Burkholderiales bacterium]
MPKESPAVVYMTIAVLLAVFAILLLVVPFDLLTSGQKTHRYVSVIADTLGETGTRLLFAVPCAVGAFIAARYWRKARA